MLKFYKNKKNGKIYKVITEQGVNANNDAEGEEFTVYYTDGTSLFHRKYHEFHEKFDLYSYHDDNYELLRKILEIKK